MNHRQFQFELIFRDGLCAIVHFVPIDQHNIHSNMYRRLQSIRKIQANLTSMSAIVLYIYFKIYTYTRYYLSI